MLRKRVCRWIGIAAAAVLLTGCSSEKAVEVYSFGEQQFSAGNSTVLMPVPFPLAAEAGEAANQMRYEGRDKNINILIMSQPIQQPDGAQTIVLTPQLLAENTVARLEKAASVHQLKHAMSEGIMEGRNAVYLDLQYTDTSGGKATELSLRSVYFQDNGQIWSVMYFFQSQDALGKDTADYIWSKIKQ